MVRVIASGIGLGVWMAMVLASTPLHALGGPGQAAAGQNKPIRTEPLFITFKGPSASTSLLQMITESDAVVRGRVVGSSPRDGQVGPVQAMRTAFHVQVLEILHAAGNHVVDPNRQLQFIVSGGDRDRGAYIERVVPDGFPLLEQGHEYLLFLKWDPYIDGWGPPYGPDGVLDIHTGVVVSAGRAALTERHKGKPAAEVLKEFRQYGQK